MPRITTEYLVLEFPPDTPQWIRDRTFIYPKNYTGAKVMCQRFVLVLDHRCQYTLLRM